MKDEQGSGRELPEAADTPEAAKVPETVELPEAADTPEAVKVPETVELPESDPGLGLPVMPGFREMALRRMPDERAARMAEDRTRLVRELAEQRQAAGLSQTEIAA